MIPENLRIHRSSNVFRITCELVGVGIYSFRQLWGCEGERLKEARTGATLQRRWKNPQGFKGIIFSTQQGFEVIQSILYI